MKGTHMRSKTYLLSITPTTILLVLGFIGCCLFSKEITDLQFTSISFDYGMAMVSVQGQVSSGKISKEEGESIGKEKLEEICKRYGFSASDYECKAKEYAARHR